MTDTTFYLVWILSFGIYLLIYTYWIPLRTQRRIEEWLRSPESDDTLLMSLEVITKKIQKQILIDFEEFMLPQARENLQKFWAGAMGNASKELMKTEEGSQLSMLANMTSELSGQPWYIQALGSKLLPLITESARSSKATAPKGQGGGLGLQKTR